MVTGLASRWVRFPTASAAMALSLLSVAVPPVVQALHALAEADPFQCMPPKDPVSFVRCLASYVKVTLLPCLAHPSDRSPICPPTRLPSVRTAVHPLICSITNQTLTISLVNCSPQWCG